MENHSKLFSDFSDEDLLLWLQNPKKIPVGNLTQLMGELKARGYTEKVNNFESYLNKFHPYIAGFWKRVAAFVIDSIFLGILGFVLGLIFHEVFVQMGGHGVLIGMLVALIYFGTFNSKIVNGQTLGKKILNLKVVNKDGHPISVGKSFLRALILVVSYFLINYHMGLQESSSLIYIKGFVFIAIMLFVMIHFAMNTHTRQAIHDLFIRTYVVNELAPPRQEFAKAKSWPFFAAGITTAVLIGISIFFFLKNQENNQTLAQLYEIQVKIRNIESIVDVKAVRGSTTFKQLGSKESNKTEFIRLDLRTTENFSVFGLNKDAMENSELVRKVVEIVLNHYGAVNELDKIHVNLIYGYDIGISRSQKSFSISNTLSDWRQIVE